MEKDKIVSYLGRNIAAVFMVTMISLLLSIIDYYHCDVTEGIQRIFVYNGITFLYFLLLCSLNYCLFEFFKVFMEAFEQIVSMIGICCFLIIAILIYFLPIHSLFHYNFSLMAILIMLRLCKQLYKKRSQSDL